jgi:hypothetical protein
MALSSDLITVIAAALTLVVGGILAFGYRCSDKSGKYEDKSQSDELNEIRMAMRSDMTVRSLDNLWKFLSESNQQLQKEGRTLDVNLLLLDVYRREPFNKLINDLEQTFTESMKIKEAWIGLKTSNGRLGNILYTYAAALSVTGFPALFLSSDGVNLLSMDVLMFLWSSVIILGLVFLIPIIITYRRVCSSRNAYQEKRKQYLIDEVKIAK